MAAVEPPESAKRQDSCPDEVESVDMSGPLSSEDILKPKGETTHSKTAEKPEHAQRGTAPTDGAAFTSHSEVGVESRAASTTCKSPDNHDAEADKNACHNTACGKELRCLDWSETDDNSEDIPTHLKHKRDLSAVTGRVEAGQWDMPTKTATEANETEINEQEKSIIEEKSTEKEMAVEQKREADEIEDEDEDVEPSTKQKKGGMVCKECGKSFNRRETFNLHRHFHLHEDELKPLTCKECGLTFQQRSSFIKHRNEHKEKDEQLLVLKRGIRKKEGGTFECAECAVVFITVDKLRDHKCSNTDEKPFHCPLCRQEFKYRASITRHMVTHSQERFQCPECNQTFLDYMSLRLHQRSHGALKPYECPECGMVFKHYSVMADHRRKHTDRSRLHVCNICGKSFKYSSLLHQHKYLHTGQKPFHCSECGKKFAFAQNLKAHCRQHSLKKASLLSTTEKLKNPVSVSAQAPVKGPEKENAHQRTDAMRTFKCPLCPQTYTTPANLRTHMLTHEAEYDMLERTSRSPKEPTKWDKGHNCPHCPSVYRDEVSLNMHLSSVHKSLASNTDNMAAVPNKPILPLSSDNIQGKVKIDGVKSYKCPECGKPFRHRSVLELHMRIHSKDKPYQCKICGKGFRFSSYLQQHLIIHTGKKPYKCPDCGKDFAFLQNMRSHQKLHQEKPFRCTSCRKGYSDEAQLQHHLLSHNGDKPHKCHICGKSFGLSYLLRDHMNTHTGERPHRCDECNKTFSWFSSLLVHQKIHSRKNSFQMGANMRGRGSRGPRGGRLIWGLTQSFAGSGTVASQSSLPFDTPLRDAELHINAGQPPPMLAVGIDLQGRQQREPSLSEMQSPVQWKVDGGEVMPVPSIQQPHVASQPMSFDNSIGSGPTSAHTVVTSHMMQNSPSMVGPGPAVPNKSSPAVTEFEQIRQLKAVSWSNHPTSVVASTSSLQNEFIPPGTYIDGGALWSVRPAATTTSLQSSPKKFSQELQLATWQGTTIHTPKKMPTPPKKDEGRTWDMGNPQVPTASQLEKPWASGLPSVSMAPSAQIDQSRSSMGLTATHGIGTTIWDIQAPSGIQKTLNSSDKLLSNSDFKLQQKQVSPSWAGVQGQTSTQKVPISIQYEPHRFGHGIGTPVWGFQSNPVGPQVMLTGQLKSGNGQELQQSMVSGTKLIINQPSHFFSPALALPPIAMPGSHPLHSVAVGALPRPPHPNIFFTPQAVTQTMHLPQLTPQTEPHKLGPRLTFPPDRLHQCMICGRSLAREVDLQMHYLQHAQGEI